MSEADLVRDFEQARRRHQAMWAAGDYTRVAEQLTGVSAALVEATPALTGAARLAITLHRRPTMESSQVKR